MRRWKQIALLSLLQHLKIHRHNMAATGPCFRGKTLGTKQGRREQTRWHHGPSPLNHFFWTKTQTPKQFCPGVPIYPNVTDQLHDKYQKLTSYSPESSEVNQDQRISIWLGSSCCAICGRWREGKQETKGVILFHRVHFGNRKPTSMTTALIRLLFPTLWHQNYIANTCFLGDAFKLQLHGTRQDCM